MLCCRSTQQSGYLKNCLSTGCVFQTRALKRAQMDLCKVYYFCEERNWTCQVAQEQKEMATSFEDTLRGKFKKKRKEKRRETKFSSHVFASCTTYPLAQQRPQRRKGKVRLYFLAANLDLEAHPSYWHPVSEAHRLKHLSGPEGAHQQADRTQMNEA